jgi:hypothetical protein
MKPTMKTFPPAIIAACVSLLAPVAMAEPPKLPAALKVRDITFHVSLVRTGEGESLKIAATGQTGASEPKLVPIKGKLGFLEAADLKNDGLPEIYVAIKPDESKKMSQLTAFVADKQKGLTPISFVANKPKAGFEFRGGDSFSFKDGHLLHHVTLYRPTDQDGSPSAWEEVTFGLSETETGGWSLIAASSRSGIGRAKNRKR